MAGVIVVGSGPAGLISALALATVGASVALVGPRPGPEALAGDTRSTALFGASLHLIERIGVAKRIGAEATPLVGLRLIDRTGGLLRAPELLFEASEIGLGQFGCNIENRVLNAALWALVDEHPGIAQHGELASGIRIEAETAGVELGTGQVLAGSLIVGADGEHSLCRTAAGIEARTWTYPQAAIATRFAHSRPHGGVSTEFHRRSGPLTTVPLGGGWSSLVWVATPDEANRLMKLDDQAFSGALDGVLEGVLGRVGGVGRRAQFALTGLEADPLACNRVALVGEAGHRLPPIGAQGLNLGVRDVGWLAEAVGEAVGKGRDPGGAGVLEAYARARRGDVASRLAVVDVLNRSLLADLLPVDLARGMGLIALRGVPWLRRLVMREGVAPSGPLPRLLRPSGDKSACGGAQA